MTEAGLYSVTVTSEAGCTSTTGTSVLVVDCARSLLLRTKIQLEGFVNAVTGCYQDRTGFVPVSSYDCLPVVCLPILTQRLK